jgi:hypothetical protein
VLRERELKPLPRRADPLALPANLERLHSARGALAHMWSREQLLCTCQSQRSFPSGSRRDCDELECMANVALDVCNALTATLCREKQTPHGMRAFRV